MGFCNSCGEVIKGGMGSKCPCGSSAGKTLTDMNDGKDNRGDSYSNAFLSSGLSQGIEKGLRKMVGMADVSSECDCEGCSTHLKGDGDIFPGRDDGKAYCESCYTQRFSLGDCQVCFKPVLGLGKEWVKEDSKLWHRKCYAGTACSACNSVIFGTAVEVDTQSWHPQCFTCTECKKNLSGGTTFCPVDGNIMCQGCAPKSRTVIINKSMKGNPSGSGSGAGSSGAKNNNGADGNAAENRALNNAAAAQRRKELDDIKRSMDTFGIDEKCAKCNQVMYGNGCKTPSGVIYHDECFNCHGCGKDFPDKRFLEKDGHVYHADCFKNKNAVKCGICNTAITGTFLEFKGQKIHSTCFKCNGCSKSLANEGFAEKDGKPHCAGCSTKVTKGDIQKKGGFTVNPVSGSKEQRDYGGMRFGGTVTLDPGLGPQCPRCRKQVFVAERVLGPSGTHWHKSCLNCAECKGALTQATLVEHDKEAYCQPCATKRFGTKRLA